MNKICGIINNGEFIADVPSQLEKWQGKTVEMSTLSKGRSNPQNRYYYGIIIPMISRELGYSNEETHNALKEKFLSKPIEITKKKTVYLMRIASTTDLSTTQMETYLKKCRDFAGEFLGIFIPLPNEKDMY